MIIPEAVSRLFTDPYFALMLRGATDACNRSGYQLILSLFTASVDSKTMHDRIVHNGYVDGVLTANTCLDDGLVPRLLDTGIPFVTIGRHPDARVSYVDVDNIGGARMATEFLIHLGHKRIGTITGPLNMTPAQDRLTGFLKAMGDNGLPVPDALIVEGDFTEAGGRAAMARLLEERPTAVFVASDSLAIGAVKAIQGAGLRVPEDISVIGFDDLPSAASLEPALTTVHQPIEGLAQLAVEVLIDRLKRRVQNGIAVQRVVLPTELMVRRSCTRPS
jgi:LacI family transcriptional regulator